MSTTASRWAESVDDLVAEVAPGSRLGVGGFHFVRAPMAAIRALCKREPLALTYVGWGGGLPLELLLEAGHVSDIVTTFSSLDTFGLAPRFRADVEAGKVGITDITALTMIKGLEAAAQNLPAQLLQRPDGSVFADSLIPIGDGLGAATEVGLSERLDVDTLLLHAQRADRDGNVELVGPRGFDRSMVFASTRVLVTVDEIVEADELGRRHSWVVPRSFVTGLAHVPHGAYPTSSPQLYRPDFRALERYAASGSLPEPDQASLEVVDMVRHLDTKRFTQQLRSLSSVAANEPWTIDELIVVLLARTVAEGAVCSVGSVSPLTGAAYRLAKILWAPRAVLMTQNGGLIDVAPDPLTLTLSDHLDLATATVAAGGDETYAWFYQSGLVTHEAVSSAQIDRHATTNNLEIDLSDDRRLRLPGQGGMADVANLHANLILYLPRQSVRNLVADAHRASAKRTLHRPEERSARGLQPGRTLLITNLAVFEFDWGVGELVLTHLHPGVNIDDVQEATGFPIRMAERVDTSEPPRPEELRVLRDLVDPLGIRLLEFSAAQERGELLSSLIAKEDAAVQQSLQGAMQ